MSNLGEQYPVEQARLRELLEQYRAIGSVGTFAHTMISGVLDEANEAAVSGDLVRMIRAFNKMQGCK